MTTQPYCFVPLLLIHEQCRCVLRRTSFGRDAGIVCSYCAFRTNTKHQASPSVPDRTEEKGAFRHSTHFFVIDTSSANASFSRQNSENRHWYLKVTIRDRPVPTFERQCTREIVTYWATSQTLSGAKDRTGISVERRWVFSQIILYRGLPGFETKRPHFELTKT
jgi:hypothetical protein